MKNSTLKPYTESQASELVLAVILDDGYRADDDYFSLIVKEVMSIDNILITDNLVPRHINKGTIGAVIRKNIDPYTPPADIGGRSRIYNERKGLVGVNFGGR